MVTSSLNGSEITAPSHYQLGPSFDADDVMKGCMSLEAYRGYWRGCALKYLIRLDRKGTAADAAKDAQKAAECARRLAATYENGAK